MGRALGSPVAGGFMRSSGDATPRRGMAFYPGFILRDVILWLGVLAVLLTLCTFSPWDLGFKADPFASAPAGIRPEWYFTFVAAVKDGLAGAAAARASAEATLAEAEARRRNLLLPLAVILVLMGLLYLKLRQLERGPGP